MARHGTAGTGETPAPPPRHAPTPRTGDCLLAFASGVFAFALYLRTLAPGLLGGDSGELQFAAWLGGLAHPTGYPLYLMSGWLWTHLLPWHDPAWRLNVFSALWGGVAAGLLYLLALRAQRALAGPSTAIAGRLPALFAAFTFAVTPTFWSQAVVAEVYTLNAALVAALLLTLVSWAERLDRRWLYAAALLFGLSLAHHRTTLLYIPAIAVFLWLTWRARGGRGAGERSPRHFRELVALLALACLPLLLYAYIPLRAPHVPYLRVEISPEQTLQLYRPTLAGFIEHVSGQGFGSALGAGRVTSAALRTTGELFIRELTLPGLLLGLAGLSWLAARSRPLLALTGLSFLALVGFNLVYGIGDIYVYYIPAYLIWVLWMAVGVAACGWAGVWVYERARKWKGQGAGAPRGAGAGESAAATRNPNRLVYLFPCLLGLLALALPLYLLSANFPQIDRSRDNAARTAWEAILAQPIPQDAILVTNDRDEMMPQWYLKYVEARRPDLTGLFPLIQPGPEWADVGAVTDRALRSGRPVALVKPMPGLEVRFALEPARTPAQETFGALEQVLGPAATEPPEHATATAYGDALRLDGYDLAPAALAPGGTAEIRLHWAPLQRLAADYTTFVHLVDADGTRIAQSDHRPGGVYYPTSLWKPGEVLVDRHVLALPPSLGRPPYTITVGLYDAAADMRHLGEPQPVGVWPPER